MSMFGTIMHKIFSAAGAVAGELRQTTSVLGSATIAAPPANDDAAALAPPPALDVPAGTPTATQPATGAAKPPAASVDVEAVLTTMASSHAGGGNWRSSIVDLLKLLDLDSSLAARKTLAQELDVHAGADGSAEENIALHRAVMAKLAENGGTVPPSLRG